MTDQTFPASDMPDADDGFDGLLVRHFSGRSSRDDRRRLDQWLAEHPDRAKELERLRDLWVRSAREPMAVEAESALARFKERARRDELAAVHAIEPTSRPRTIQLVLVASRWRRLSVAVAATLVIAAGAGVWWRERVVSPPAIATTTTPQLYATARGQRFTVRLPDGTTVLLAPSSMLEVPAGFGAGGRDVRLSGLGFFSVAKDASRPFRVRGGSGVVQVLGTKFAVRASGGSGAEVEVVVSEGRVVLRPSNVVGKVSARDSVLVRGDLGSVDTDDVVKVTHGVDLASRLGWIEGHLAFDRAPLPTVLQELEAWYDVDFVVTSPTLRGARLTATFDSSSFGDVLRQLETALGANAEVHGKTVMLQRTRHSSE